MLLAHFGSPAAIMCATAEALAQVPGIGKKSAADLAGRERAVPS